MTSPVPGTRHKTLLLTDLPPSSNLTAGLVTAQMCRFIPPGDLVIVCVQNVHLTPQPFPDLAHIPIKTIAKPNENQRRELKGIPIGRLGAACIETVKRSILPSRLSKQAVEFGRQHGVSSVWAVLQGQTMVRMAHRVATALDVPLRSHVWDPLGWWLDAHGVDPMNRFLDLKMYDKILQGSVTCATASPAMAEAFRNKYGVQAWPVIASLDRNLAKRPTPALRNTNEIAIAMVGQFYASAEWHQFVRALTFADWRVGDRKVVLRTFGHQPPPSEIPKENLEFMGWKSQAELIGTLSETCDIAYCPYPFSADMEDVAKLSFPSKVPTYLAAGRPILFHGPSYSSPAKYLTANGAGVVVRDIYPSAVFDGLLHLVEDKDRYHNAALAAQKAFLDDFTLETMRDNVLRFLGYGEEFVRHRGKELPVPP